MTTPTSPGCFAPGQPATRSNAAPQSTLCSAPRVAERLAEFTRDRRLRGIDSAELVHEFEILAATLDAACLGWVDEFPGRPGERAVLRVVGRLNRAPLLMAETALAAYREHESAVRLREERVWWVVVSDNGLGIPCAERPRIFERFFRAHPKHAPGSGLGLAIVREAAEQMGSRLQVESEPGKGSTFRFSLPVT